MSKKGKVYLVGAGPGDPGLLTLKGKALLARADVVLYDALAHPNLLSYCSDKCQLVLVGKRKGKHSEKQSSINEKMVSFAKKGKQVVRLKGGDPLIFGRGGEEMAYLTKHKIPFEVIPGITSAIAVPSYAGIPLTHRNLSRSVAFVTGTLKKDEAQFDIPIADTLVFLMAVTNLEQIVDHILKLDRFSESTPAALINHGTLAEQEMHEGTLETIVAIKNKMNVKTPAIFVVGDVVALAQQFNWRSQLPLSGKRIIVLRDKDQAQSYVDRFSELGAETLVVPMIDIVPIKKEQDELTKAVLDAHNIVIFTSSNGVLTFMKTLKKNKCDVRALADTTIIAVGPKTAEALENNGIVADLVPKQHDVEGILAELPDQLRGEKVLLPLAIKARDALEVGLQIRGAITKRINLYNTKKPEIKAVPIYDNDHIIFTSPSTAEHFFESGLYNNQAIHVYSIGKQSTAKIAEFYDGKIHTAKTATLDSLIDLIKNNSK